MSYDLFIKPKRTGRKAFESYFEDRMWWTVKPTESGVQAWYENEDSGVYFSFDWSEKSIAFNMNYFRPSFFGLEAADEVTAFVDAFGGAIHDPQSDGMGSGPFTRDGFVRGWASGNRFGHRAILSQHDASGFYSLPAARLQALWRWNYQRERTTDVLNTVEMVPCFVPKITPVVVDEQLQMIVIWDATIPILLPEVDAILAPRGEGLGLIPRRALDGVLAEWRIRPADDEMGKGRQLGLAAREVVFETDEVPASITRAVEQHAIPWAGEGVSWDQIHDAELLKIS